MLNSSKRIRSLVAFALITIDGILLGQGKPWQLILSDGDTLSNCTLIRLSGDSLDTSAGWVKIPKINEIRSITQPRAWETSKQYAITSGIVGAVVSAVVIGISAHGTHGGIIETDDTSAKVLGVMLGAPVYGAVCALLGGIVGYVVGLVESQDEVYDLSQMFLNQRIHTIGSLLAEGAH